jgi:hypothetical protein
MCLLLSASHLLTHKAGAYPGVVSYRTVLQGVGFYPRKYKTRLKVSDSDKHNSLLVQRLYYDLKKFYSRGSGLVRD